MAKKRKKSTEKDIFKQVKKNTNVSEKQIKSLANQVNPTDLKDEKKLRQLIAQVAAVAGVQVSKEKEDQIINYFTKNNVSMQQMQSMVQMFLQSPKK